MHSIGAGRAHPGASVARLSRLHNNELRFLIVDPNIETLGVGPYKHMGSRKLVFQVAALVEERDLVVDHIRVLPDRDRVVYPTDVATTRRSIGGGAYRSGRVPVIVRGGIDIAARSRAVATVAPGRDGSKGHQNCILIIGSRGLLLGPRGRRQQQYYKHQIFHGHPREPLEDRHAGWSLLRWTTRRK
jgi:hypothetical protein